MSGKGQVWSIDVVIAVVIFITVLGIFIQNLTSTQRDTTATSLESNAETMLTEFRTNPKLDFITDNGMLNRSKLKNLSDMGYAKLKEKLNVQGNFCIFVQDKEGNLVPIGGKTSIGDDTLNVSGKECGSTV